MSIFDKWNQEYNCEEIVKEIESQNSPKSFEEVPYGEYEVSVEKLELVESKKGQPMLSAWFKIVNGDFENSIIFYNQVITSAFQISKCNNLLRSLARDIPDCEIKFDNFSQYDTTITTLHDKIKGYFEYALVYKEGKKGFKEYEITEVFHIQ